MKTNLLITLCFLFITYSCNSEIDSEDTNRLNIGEYLYSKDNNIIYSNSLAEDAFKEKGSFIELSNGLSIKRINDSIFLYDSDMVLTKEQVLELEKYNEINPNIKTKGTIDRNARSWANKKVYYTFNSNVTAQFKNEINKAINEWRKQSGLEFIERTNQTNYIEFILGDDGSYSQVGCVGGRQYINLDKSWADSGTAMHEIGHAIGLLHEHQSWIYHDNPMSPLKFKWDNITENWKKHYAKTNSTHDTFSNGMYDPNHPINSLMIYGSFAGAGVSIDQKKPVMIYAKFGVEMTFKAQRSYLSISDRIAVAKKYGYSYDPEKDQNKPPI